MGLSVRVAGYFLFSAKTAILVVMPRPVCPDARSGSTHLRCRFHEDALDNARLLVNIFTITTIDELAGIVEVDPLI